MITKCSQWLNISSRTRSQRQTQIFDYSWETLVKKQTKQRWYATFRNLVKLLMYIFHEARMKLARRHTRTRTTLHLLLSSFTLVKHHSRWRIILSMDSKKQTYYFLCKLCTYLFFYFHAQSYSSLQSFIQKFWPEKIICLACFRTAKSIVR